MPSRTTTATLDVAFVCLLLCGVFASKLPELLNPTDNALNEHMVGSAEPFVSPVLAGTISVLRPPIEFNISRQDWLFGHMDTPEKTELALCCNILHLVLRR